MNKPPEAVTIHRKNLHVERAKLSNSLHNFKDDDDKGRYPIVQKIKQLNKEIAATYQPEKAKTEPKKKADKTPKDRLDALRMKQNASANRTKWYKQLEKATDADRTKKCIAKIEEFETIMAKMDEYISNHEWIYLRSLENMTEPIGGKWAK